MRHARSYEQRHLRISDAASNLRGVSRNARLEADARPGPPAVGFERTHVCDAPRATCGEQISGVHRRRRVRAAQRGHVAASDRRGADRFGILASRTENTVGSSIGPAHGQMSRRACSVRVARHRATVDVPRQGRIRHGVRDLEPYLVHALDGVLTEIYYPTVDRPQVRDFQYLITDGSTFFHEERRHLGTSTERIAPQALGYRVTNEDPDGRYAIVKEIISDPHSPCILQHTTLDGESDLLSRLRSTRSARPISPAEAGAITPTSSRSPAAPFSPPKSRAPGSRLERTCRSAAPPAATWVGATAGLIWPTAFRWRGSSTAPRTGMSRSRGSSRSRAERCSRWGWRLERACTTRSSPSCSRSFPLNNTDPGPLSGQFPTDPFLVNGPVILKSEGLLSSHLADRILR